MEQIKELEITINSLKANMAKLKKEIAIKKDCEAKKNKYDNDETFREARKQKSRQYYYDVVKPKIENAKVIL